MIQLFKMCVQFVCDKNYNKTLKWPTKKICYSLTAMNESTGAAIAIR